MHVLQALFTPLMYQEKVFLQREGLKDCKTSIKIMFFCDNFYYSAAVLL